MTSHEAPAAADQPHLKRSFLRTSPASHRSPEGEPRWKPSGMDARERTRRTQRAETGLSGRARATPSDQAWHAAVDRRGDRVRGTRVRDARHRETVILLCAVCTPRSIGASHVRFFRLEAAAFQARCRPLTVNGSLLCAV